MYHLCNCDNLLNTLLLYSSNCRKIKIINIDTFLLSYYIINEWI